MPLPSTIYSIYWLGDCPRPLLSPLASPLREILFKLPAYGDYSSNAWRFLALFARIGRASPSTDSLFIFLTPSSLLRADVVCFVAGMCLPLLYYLCGGCSRSKSCSYSSSPSPLLVELLRRFYPPLFLVLCWITLGSAMGDYYMRCPVLFPIRALLCLECAGAGTVANESCS